MNFRLAYHLKESPTAATTLVFLHGFLGKHQEWDAIWPLFFPQFSCLRIDLPGHGKSISSIPIEAYRMEKTAQCVMDLMVHLKKKKNVLIGYSMGGRLALYLALHFPQYWTNLILESASPGLKTEEERKNRRLHDEKLAQQLETEPFEHFLKKWYQQPLFAPTRNHPQFEKLFQHRLKNDPIELAKSLRFMGTGNQPSLWENISSLQVPTLLLAGEQDTKFCQIASEMTLLCSAFKMEKILEVGHNLHFENPNFFIASLRKFIT